MFSSDSRWWQGDCAHSYSLFGHKRVFLSLTLIVVCPMYKNEKHFKIYLTALSSHHSVSLLHLVLKMYEMQSQSKKNTPH